jgi:hypothetical protein
MLDPDPDPEKMNTDPKHCFLELRNHFLGLNLNSLMRIRDPGWRQFGSGGSGMGKSRIGDQHPGSATLITDTAESGSYLAICVAIGREA